MKSHRCVCKRHQPHIPRIRCGPITGVISQGGIQRVRQPPWHSPPDVPLSLRGLLGTGSAEGAQATDIHLLVQLEVPMQGTCRAAVPSASPWAWGWPFLRVSVSFSFLEGQSCWIMVPNHLILTSSPLWSPHVHRLQSWASGFNTRLQQHRAPDDVGTIINSTQVKDTTSAGAGSTL